MSLTEDMRRLKDVADKIAKERGNEFRVPFLAEESKGDSYYKRRTDNSKKLDHILMEYGFDTPIELKKCLDNIWKNMEKEEMMEFVPACMVAAMKNKPLEKQRILEHKVSEYIYEF